LIKGQAYYFSLVSSSAVKIELYHLKAGIAEEIVQNSKFAEALY
tara:strand:+ start:1884 stop:2015 length:132 start_codon:yes stop_codon:yes gene_type:complete